MMSLHYRLGTLERLYVEQLERMGDFDGALAVLRSDLSTPHRYLDVTRFLERHNRMRGLRQRGGGLAALSAGLAHRGGSAARLRADGWFDEAQHCGDGSSKGTESQGLQPRSRGVEGWLIGRRSAPIPRHGAARNRADARATTTLRARPGDDTAGKRNVSLRAQVLLAEGRADEALALVQPPAVCHPFVRELHSRSARIDTTRPSPC
jgi:hypothetical protein